MLSWHKRPNGLVVVLFDKAFPRLLAHKGLLQLVQVAFFVQGSIYSICCKWLWPLKNVGWKTVFSCTLSRQKQKLTLCSTNPVKSRDWSCLLPLHWLSTIGFHNIAFNSLQLVQYKSRNQVIQPWLRQIGYLFFSDGKYYVSNNKISLPLKYGEMLNGETVKKW